MNHLKTASSARIAILLAIFGLVLTGCQPVQKQADPEQVLKDIRDTTVIPDLGSNGQ